MLSVLIFPKPEIFTLTWICLVPLLVVTYQETAAKRAFAFGWSAGVCFFFGVCFWIIRVLRLYGGLTWVSAFWVFLSLAAYLSLFYGLFSLGFSRLSLRFPSQCFHLCPFLWVATEYLRAHLLTGFPWCLMGYALVEIPDLAQLSTFTGVYGVSFVVVAINGVVAALLLTPPRRAVQRLVAACLLVFSISVYFSSTRQALLEGSSTVRIIQTNIDLDQRWDLSSRSALLDELTNLSLGRTGRKETPIPGGLRITLWPETPAPFYLNHDQDFRSRMQSLAKTSGSYFLFGFVDFRESLTHPNQRDPYNSVALLSPQGDVISQYDKVHLVPFGEYIPYANVFFFIDKISTEAGNFRAGNKVVVSSLAQDRRLGAFVCYEAIIPDLVRRFADEGAQILVNVTNDGWFGDSAAPFQHLNMARFRAIENQRYLLRAANSGISAIVDPYGSVLASSEMNVRTVLESKFEFESRLTFYSRHGDIFAWVSLGVSVVLLAWATLRFRRDLS